MQNQQEYAVVLIFSVLLKGFIVAASEHRSLCGITRINLSASYYFFKIKIKVIEAVRYGEWGIHFC
jgi:hypothetical protein